VRLPAYCWMGIEGQIMYQVVCPIAITIAITTSSCVLHRSLTFCRWRSGVCGSIHSHQPRGRFATTAAVRRVRVRLPGDGGGGDARCVSERVRRPRQRSVLAVTKLYTGGIWAITAPALLITAVNTIVFHKILRHLRTVLDVAASDKRVKTWVSATFSTVMGGTWLFAIIMLFTDGTVRTVITVIFTVINGYCGVRFPSSSALPTCYRLALRIDTLRCIRVKHAMLHRYTCVANDSGTVAVVYLCFSRRA
jgi:hypothetical protein